MARMKASLARSAPVNAAVGDVGEHHVGLLASAEPINAYARDESLPPLPLRRGLPHRPVDRPAAYPNTTRRPGGPDEQVRIRLEVGVQTEGGAAHHDPDVFTVVGHGELSRDQSPQTPQPQWWRARLRRTSP